MSAVDRLIDVASAAGAGWSMSFDENCRTRELRYDVRVVRHREPSFRIRETGATVYEAAAKAADAVSARAEGDGSAVGGLLGEGGARLDG